MNRLVAIVFCFCFCFCANAWAASGCDGSGNCYIRPGASGAGDGSSWTDAYTGFGSGSGKINPSSMIRGTTYWLSAGSYGSVTFNTPASGSSAITIEAATTSSHGPASDWSNSYAGQAIFGESAITTSYWTVNGQSWAGSACTGLETCGMVGGASADSAYNMYFHNATDGGSSAAALSVGPGTNFNIEYVDIQGTGTLANWNTSNGNSDDALVTPGGANPTNNLYVGHSYIHDAGVDLVGSNNQTSSTQTNGDGHTYEYDFFARDWHAGFTSGDPHAQAMSECVTNFNVRYNVFFDTAEDGTIDINVSNTCPISNWHIYGNTIEWDNNIPSSRRAMTNGFLGFFGETVTGVVEVYNNSFVNVNPGTTGNPVTITPLWICGTSCGSNGTGATFTVYNNLFYNSGDSHQSDWVCDSSCSTETPTADYNEGYCPTGGCTNGAGYSPSGSHDLSATGNPFVNFDGNTNFNVSLVADTAPGLSIPNWSTTPSGCSGNCENIDPLGVVRGADGTIDRGAFQIAGSSDPPNPPTGLKATVN